MGGEASFFLGFNRGKRGISIDLKNPDGDDLCLRLIDKMDVLMDLVVQSSSGLLSITGTEAGESVRCGYGVTDVTAGL